MPRGSGQLQGTRPRAQSSVPAIRRRKRVGCATERLPTVPLIATGGGFGLPVLAGVPTNLELVSDDGRAARLATSLLKKGIAGPADWRAGGNAIEFVATTLQRVLDRAGAVEISREFPMDITLSDTILPVYDAQPVADPAVLYLTAEPTAAGYCVIGGALDLLGKLDPRLPVTFYRRMHAAIGRAVRYYDYRDALERVAYLHDCYDGEEEAMEYPDVGGAMPPQFEDQKPLSAAALKRLHAAAGPGQPRMLLGQLFELEQASSGLRFPELTDEEREQLSDCNPCLPALLTVFRRHDAIGGCFDEEMQYAQECPPEPSVIIPFRPGDAASVVAAFRLLEKFCKTMLAAARLLESMPGNKTKYD